MRPDRFIVVLIAALAVIPGDAAAQQRAAARGWLGFSYNTSWQRSDERVVIRVTDVVEDSPAERAGLQRGDTLIAVNGLAASEPLLGSLAFSLSPGDEVTLRVRRAGRERDLTATAGPRPANYAIATPNAYIYSFDADSLRDRMLMFRDSVFVNLDSLRIPMMRMQQFFGDSVRWRMFSDSLGRFQLRLQDSLRVHWDSIARHSARLAEREMRRLSIQLDTLRRHELRSLDSLRLRGLRGRMDSLRVRGDGWFYVWGGDSTWVLRGDSLGLRYGLQPGEPFGYTTLSMFGGRAIAGAELSELHEGLDEYFGVEDGVLVMRVPEDTPADRAGLEAGDVIVRAGDRDVDSIDDLRRAFATVRRGDDLRLEIVRKQRRMTVELRRD